METNVPVFIYFYQAKHTYSQQFEPMVDEFISELGENIKIIKVDVKENPTSAREYNVTMVPTLIMFKQGEIIEQLIGTQNSIEAIYNKFGKHIMALDKERPYTENKKNNELENKKEENVLWSSLSNSESDVRKTKHLSKRIKFAKRAANIAILYAIVTSGVAILQFIEGDFIFAAVINTVSSVSLFYESKSIRNLNSKAYDAGIKMAKNSAIWIGFQLLVVLFGNFYVSDFYKFIIFFWLLADAGLYKALKVAEPVFKNAKMES